MERNDSLQFQAIPSICPDCGGTMVYKGLGEYICDKCAKQVLNDYGKVRNYIEQHPGATQADVAMNTGVSQGKIRQMLIEEKLEVTPNSPIFLHCALCNAEIRSGKYCEACAQKLKQDEAKVAKVVKAQQRKAGYLSSDYSDAKGRRRFERQ